MEVHNERDLDRFGELTTDDFELVPAIAGSLEDGGIHGGASKQRYAAMLDETWEGFRIIADEFRDLGDPVLVLGRTEARGRGSGMPVQAAWAGIMHPATASFRGSAAT